MKPDKRKLLAALERFGGVKVAVVGDLLADVYIYARPVGLSREAPVMVLHEESEKISPGGAANAVNNVLELAGKAVCVGVLGDDPAGSVLSEFLERRGADGARIVTAKGESTYTKTRVFAGDIHTVKQQVFRIDRRPKNRMTKAVERKVLASIDAAAKGVAAWLISDYDGDFFCDAVIDRLDGLAGGKVMVVDSHTRLTRFHGVTCATPNEAEAAHATGIEVVDDASALEAAKILAQEMGARHVFVTRGNRGMTVAGRGKEHFSLPIVGPSEIVDVAGAGDTVAAVVTLALASGADALTAGLLASYAASVVCMKTGVATASPAEVRAAVEEYPLPEI